MRVDRSPFHKVSAAVHIHAGEECGGDGQLTASATTTTLLRTRKNLLDSLLYVRTEAYPHRTRKTPGTLTQNSQLVF